MRHKKRNEKGINQRGHAKFRFAERYGVALNRKGYDEIIKMIQTGNSTKIAQISCRVTAHRVVYEGIVANVLYDRRRKELVTALPKDAVETGEYMSGPLFIVRLKAILSFIVMYKQEHGGNSPTIREIGDWMHIDSTSLVEYYLRSLEDKKYITRSSGVSRSIVVINPTFEE
jgi:hypothetical protein